MYKRQGVINDVKERRLTKDSKLKLSATPEELNYSAERGFQAGQMRELLQCSWVSYGWNILISGETGTGKTWIGCCIATAAIRNATKSKYYKIDDLRAAHNLRRAQRFHK